MKRWLEEPLLHFLLAGALLFAVHAGIRGSETRFAPERPSVHVTRPEVEWLAQTWTRQWRRPPDARELRGLVADFVKEELLASEAKELGLGDDDTVVRRRLAQKMEFLRREAPAPSEPDERELREIYEANRDRFADPARVSFEQVFFAAGADGEARARRALGRLAGVESVADAAALGDPSLVEPALADADEAAVADAFGADFTKAVFALETDRWSGPIASAYGVHLVRVTGKLAARTKPFDEVRKDVVEEWRRAHEEADEARYFASLLEKYELVVDDDVEGLLGSIELALASARPR